MLQKYPNIGIILPYKALAVMTPFHAQYEPLHLFHDGNSRTDRLILFRECLKTDLTSVIIVDNFRTKYIEELKEYRDTRKNALLMELFIEEQKEYAKKVAYFLGEELD